MHDRLKQFLLMSMLMKEYACLAKSICFNDRTLGCVFGWRISKKKAAFTKKSRLLTYLNQSKNHIGYAGCGYRYTAFEADIVFRSKPNGGIYYI